MKQTPLEIYRDALINIYLFDGECWDIDGRNCHDSSHVAGRALKKAESMMLSYILENRNNMKVLKTGKIKMPKMKRMK